MRAAILATVAPDAVSTRTSRASTPRRSSGSTPSHTSGPACSWDPRSVPAWAGAGQEGQPAPAS